MEDNELKVAEPTTTEKVDTQTTEQVEEVKDNNDSNEVTFTDAQKAQMNKIIQERVSRAKRAEEKKYSNLMNTLQAGFGTKDLNEITQKATEFYKDQGVEIPNQPVYDEEDERVLANNEAQKIIDLGYDEIVNETEEMMKKGNENLTPREKLIFKDLAEKRKEIEDIKSLKAIGVDESVIESKRFQDYAKKFKDGVSINEIYEDYSTIYPQEDEKDPIGSVKSTAKDDGIKDYYSPEDFDRLTDEQKNNPTIWKKVMESRTKWIK